MDCVNNVSFRLRQGVLVMVEILQERRSKKKRRQLMSFLCQHQTDGLNHSLDIESTWILYVIHYDSMLCVLNSKSKIMQQVNTYRTSTKATNSPKCWYKAITVHFF